MASDHVRGYVALVASSAAFATSGPFGKSLIVAGWTPGMVVLVRIAGAALVLLPFTVAALRGRGYAVARELPLVVGYGALAVGAAQVGYFQAVSRMAVGVALLIEYLGLVLVVGWVWAVRRRPPHPLTLVGVALALVGLALVLDIAGVAPPPGAGVGWGLLAACGLAGHYVLAAKETVLPPVAFAGLGLIAGAGSLGLVGLLGVLPMRASSAPVDIAGIQLPAWVALIELCVVAAALAYLIGIVGARALGSTVASFVGLTEVIFAILLAWLLLGELPRVMQLIGGLLILGGVVAVRLAEFSGRDEVSGRDTKPSESVSIGPDEQAAHEPDFTATSPIA